MGEYTTEMKTTASSKKYDLLLNSSCVF